MNISKLTDAIKEAERFIAAANRAQARLEQDWQFDSKRLSLHNRAIYSNTSKENAACKRASLDLTRALADLRKP